MCICNGCDHLVLTNSISISDGLLVLQIDDEKYLNNLKYCIGLAQELPDGVDDALPVVVQIGTNIFNIRTKRGHKVYSDQLVDFRVYPMVVAADTSTFVYFGDCLPRSASTIPGAL